MVNKPTEPALNERAQHLLKALVERYIKDGQPVGSRVLSRDSGLDLSPASIRNVMADLEEMGFLAAPHTSAGRIPTVKGYRFFIDTLLTLKPLSDIEVDSIRKNLSVETGDSQALIASASKMLSAITHMAGIVTVPRREHYAWRQIEFLPLSDYRVLVILVVNEREVQNRIINLDKRYSASTLQQAANYLNEQFSGRTIEDIRRSLLQELREAREDVNALMLTAIGMAERLFTVEGDGAQEEGGFLLAGQTNLMEFADLSDVEKLRRLFEAFNQKRDILHLLDRCIIADGVQIFIGEESGYQVLDDLSVVTSPYSVGDDMVGVLGVIGPTRMAYERVIPIVDITARLMTSALNSRK